MLTVTAGLFAAVLPQTVRGAGNPIPISGTFFVSPTGNDTANGDFNAPLATLGKAKDLAVQWINQSDGGNYPNSSAEIFLRGGRYALVSPASNPLAPGLEITGAETRPEATITFRNYLNETAVIHGALELTLDGSPDSGSWQSENLYVYNGGTSATSSPAGRSWMQVQKYVFSGALRAQLAERISNMRAARVNGGNFCFTEMYVGGDRKMRARHPNLRAIQADTSRFNATEAIVQQNKNLTVQQPIVRFNSTWLEADPTGTITDVDLLADPGARTEIIFSRAWQWGRGVITEGPVTLHSDNVPRMAAKIGAMLNPAVNSPAVDNSDFLYPEGQLADFNSITSIDIPGLETWNRCRLENNKHFIDRPGEWFFDDDQIALYYYPAAGEPITTQKFEFPVTYRLVALTGRDADPVTGVQFIGQGTGNTTANDPYYVQFEKSAWKYDNNRGDSEYYSSRQTGYVQTGLIDGIHVDGFQVKYCKFSQFGAAGIKLGGNRMWSNGLGNNRNNYDNQPRGEVKNVVIDNNYITDGGGSAIDVNHYPNLANQRSVLDYYYNGPLTETQTFPGTLLTFTGFTVSSILNGGVSNYLLYPQEFGDPDLEPGDIIVIGGHQTTIVSVESGIWEIADDLSGYGIELGTPIYELAPSNTPSGLTVSAAWEVPPAGTVTRYFTLYQIGGFQTMNEWNSDYTIMGNSVDGVPTEIPGQYRFAFSGTLTCTVSGMPPVPEEFAIRVEVTYTAEGHVKATATGHSKHIGITRATSPTPTYDLTFQFRPRNLNPTTGYIVTVTATNDPQSVIHEGMMDANGRIALGTYGAFDIQFAAFCEGLYFRRVLSTDGTAPLDNNDITENAITWIGKNFADGVGIHVPHGTNTWIYGNSIRDVPYNAISAGYGCFRGSNQLIQVRANGVTRAMRKLIDGAGIYTGGGRRMNIMNNTMVDIGATRDVDAVVASSNPRLINDLYFDLSSRGFTITANAATETYLDLQAGHNVAGQGGSFHDLALELVFSCPDDPNDFEPDNCCGN